MWNITNIWNPSKRISIDAHDNNIPCIKFSPCGRKKVSYLYNLFDLY